MSVVYFVIQQTMYFAIPLLIVAIGAMYSERSGVINIAMKVLWSWELLLEFSSSIFSRTE